MKVNILFKLKNGPTGGGNQFLKSLKNYLQSTNVYADDVQKADVILLNSYQYIDQTAEFKLNHAEKIFVHRIDGPIRVYNKAGDRRDYVTNIANHLIADATIFQSEWSRNKNYQLGLKKNKFEAVISNASDPLIFNPDGRESFSAQRKIRLLAASWSANWNKGFKVYKWLDENLDFDKYEMVFVGNSPLRFKNIRHQTPLASIELAAELKKNDIFIFASPIEACSNSILEALHCRLPVVGINASSNPELIGKAEEVFDAPEQIPALLEKIVSNYNYYCDNIRVATIDDIGARYVNFVSEIHQQYRDEGFNPKPFGCLRHCRVMATIYLWKFAERINAHLKDMIGGK